MKATVREYLDALMPQALACRLQVIQPVAAAMVEAIGDRPLLEVTAWELEAPLGRAGYDLAEYLEHRRDWNNSYVETTTTPWIPADDGTQPHPLLEEHARRGFGGAGRVLELGCGVGANAAFLAERGADVLGVDIAASAIAWGKNAFGPVGGRLSLEVGDSLGLDVAAGSFDFLLDSWCLHHIPVHLMPRHVSRAAEALRHAGELLLFVHSPKYNRTEGLLFLSTGVVGKALRYVLEHDSESCFSAAELERLLEPKFLVESIDHHYDHHLNADRHYSFVVRAKRR
ncbi:MAG: class I SAM-dependent methyltransferase [Deltaproteobacteria bacterium]